MVTELESLYQWYGEMLDSTNDHEDMLRFQAARRLLRYLFSGTLENAAVSRHQTTTTTVEDYMQRDAFDGQEPN